MLMIKKYTKTKLKKFNDVVNTNVCVDKISEGGMHNTCIVCIRIDSVINIEKKRIIHKFIQYKEKKTKMSEFVDVESESDSYCNSKQLCLQGNVFKAQ